jgi:hypothetical protein
VAAVKKIGLLCALLLAFLSCSPPFDANLSLTAINLSRLTYQSVVDTGIQVWPDSPAYDAVFMPVKASGTLSTVDPSRGFILFTSSNQVNLMYVEPDGKGGYVRVPDPSTSGPVGIGGLFGKDPNYPSFEMRTVPDGIYAAVFSYDSSQPGNNSSLIYWQDSPGHIASASASNFSNLLLSIMAPAVVIGAQYVPSSAIGGDGMYWLARDNAGSIHEATLTTINFSGFSGPTDNTGPLSPTSPITAAFSSLNRCLYYHDAASGISYASFHAGGAWQCWRWDSPSGGNFKRIAGITCRIDALLTTGELLSTQDGEGRLFDPQGNLLTRFPFGALRFSMEAYVNGTATVFLSRSLVTDGSLSLELYSIPSSRLKSLSY